MNAKTMIAAVCAAALAAGAAGAPKVEKENPLKPYRSLQGKVTKKSGDRWDFQSPDVNMWSRTDLIRDYPEVKLPPPGQKGEIEFSFTLEKLSVGAQCEVGVYRRSNVTRYDAYRNDLFSNGFDGTGLPAGIVMTIKRPLGGMVNIHFGMKEGVPGAKPGLDYGTPYFNGVMEAEDFPLKVTCRFDRDHWRLSFDKPVCASRGFTTGTWHLAAKAWEEQMTMNVRVTGKNSSMSAGGLMLRANGGE